MAARSTDPHDAPQSPATAPSHEATAGEEGHKDHFLQLMFFQASHPSGEPRGDPHPGQLTGAFAPLRHSGTMAAGRYDLAAPGSASAVGPRSPAIEVMTDLRRVSAVTVERGLSIAEANRMMIARGVRALFVVDDARRVLGIVTATDILGERPVQFAQAREIRYDEVTAGDIMTPAERLEVLDLRDVMRARIGDIVATLRSVARQHALVAEAARGAPAGQWTICGIFSLTQIGRRLGIPPQQIHDIARTFAEIEALIASH
jgi:CBS domain-containing protein